MWMLTIGLHLRPTNAKTSPAICAIKSGSDQNELGEARLSDLLQLRRTGKGENIVVERPRDKHLFNEGIEAAPGIWCTGLIQTYLDLHSTGERGAEAAAPLRKHRIEPLWKAAN